jgi:CO dehydrogenase maturation factor
MRRRVKASSEFPNLFLPAIEIRKAAALIIAIGGKGGSGKTTISGIIARTLGRKHGRVLAIDGDSNPNLALTLGLPAAELMKLPVLPRDLLEQVPEEGGKTRTKLKVSTQEVISQFGVPAPDNATLLVVGRVGHAGAG